MSRKVNSLDFARVWGEISRWPKKKRDDLAILLRDLSTAKDLVGTKRESRKAKGGPAEVAG